MADDIDIEEHDVLESLRRRRGPGDGAEAPDSIIVKSEPLDIEYDPHYEESANECHWEWDKDAPEIKIEPHTEQEDIPFGKIILGSKPSTPPPRELSPEEYNYNVALVLDDWGPMLDRSECYCRECQILFATVNALDSHKMLAHSFLVAIDEQASPERNKAFKSTAKPTNEDTQTCELCQFHFKGITGKSNLKRHYRQVHQVDPDTLENKSFKSWRLCNHCNLYFPNDTSLVKHLYELLPLNNRTPTKDDRKSVAQSPGRAKPALNLGKGAKTVSRDVKTYNKQTNRIILGSKPSGKTEPTGSRSDDLKTDKYKCEDIAYEKPQKSPDKIILDDANVRYKCIVCNQILLTHYLACKHRAKHPDIRRRKIIVKLVKSKAKSNAIPPTKAYKKEPKSANKDTADDVPRMIVSKSVIFKCNRCSVHFLTCTGACQHSIVCESSSNIRDWECPQCQKVFKSAERRAHEYQHEATNGKLKVHVVYQEMIVRVLCECPHCFVCFEEDKFWQHVNSGCDRDVDSYYCGECRLPIHADSRHSHDSKHKQGDFTKDDFIKIDYITPDIILPKIKREPEEPRGTKRKLEMPELPQKKSKPNPVDQFKLFYCSICKQYFGSRSEFHVNGKCRGQKKKIRSFCKICGIYFSHKYHRTHMSLHEERPGLTIANFAFVRLSDSKKIKPQPEAYPCKKCDVYFVKKITRRIHDCDETESSYCQICQKKIQRDAYKVHMQIHNYVIPGKVKSNEKVPKVASPKPLPRNETELPLVLKLPLKETKSPMAKLPQKEIIPPITKLPDLLMKYQSLTALWNILYLCATCDTFTDSYDKVVEHCQNHLTNMENYGVLINMCHKCDMKFDSECYKRHLELHAGNKIINKKTFQILKYEYFNLFSDNWFDFINVPDEQKSQIIKRSIYGENRCVRMRLSRQGPPECTLYRCSKCDNCVSADTIVYHVRLVQCVKANKVACSICDMTFTTRVQCERHELVHKATGLGAESFRIVAFNDPRDSDTNTKIMAYDKDHQATRTKIAFADDEIQPKPKLPKLETNKVKKHFVFYKCAQCHVCLVHLKNFNRHACSSDKRKQECGKCGLLFNNKMYNYHKQIHAKYSFSKKNVITKTVNKDGKVVNIIKQSLDNVGAARPRPEKPELSEEPKLYKCYCGLHFTSLRTIEKHYKLKNCSTVIREKCSQCDLTFDPIEVVNHLCKHHAQSRVKSFHIVTPNKKTLYKCGVCHVLFYNKDAAVLHKSRCIGKYCAKKCLKCGLAFDAISLSTHLVDHERNDKLRTDCYIIVKIPDEKPKIEKPKSPSTLYRCKICDIHFLQRPSARNHLIYGRHGHTKPKKCKICGLGFLPKTMPKHVAWQHHKLKIKEFDVKELVVGVNTATPRPDSNLATQIKEAKAPVKKPAAEAVTPKVKPVPKEAKQRERKVFVYKCSKCALHFTQEKSLAAHREDRCSKELGEECEDCAVKFAAKNIKEHKKQHSPGVTLNLKVVANVTRARNVRKKVARNRVSLSRSRVSLSRYDNTLYRCTGCDFHYNCFKTLQCHSYEPCNPDAARFKCEECDISFKKQSLHLHKLIHEKYKFKKDDFTIFTMADLDNSDLKIKKEQDERPKFQEDTMVALGSSFELEPREKSKTPTSKVKEPKKVEPDMHTLCKCADCNVYFVTLRACHKHIINHTPFDSKDYIECKLCGFQFTIMTLPIHIKKHHEKQFNLEQVLVEEYRPNDVETCERYYASEKDQSRLVSTSDDVKNVTNSNEENDNEVTSCNQIESSSFKSETDSQDTTDSTEVRPCEQVSNLTVLTESSSDSNVNAEPLEESSTEVRPCEQVSNLTVLTESSSDSNVNAEPLEESSTEVRSCEQVSNLTVPTESSSDSNVNAEPLEESILT